jgi:hypothetical protein
LREFQRFPWDLATQRRVKIAMDRLPQASQVENMIGRRSLLIVSWRAPRSAENTDLL